jgi:hypothetical protein
MPASSKPSREPSGRGQLTLVVDCGGQCFRTAAKSGVTIGRAPECTIRLDDPDLGWVHARVYGGTNAGGPLALVGDSLSLRRHDSPCVSRDLELLPGMEFALTSSVRAWCVDEKPPVPTLRLTFIHDGQGRVVAYHDGLTVGRSLDCTVSIDDPDLCAVHARTVWDGRGGTSPRMVSDVPGFAFVLPNGRDAQSVELRPGCEFTIGERVRVRCDPIDPLPVPALPVSESDQRSSASAGDLSSSSSSPSPSPPLRVSCPRCREFILHLSGDARFCPKCGLVLPECCPPWEFSNDSAAREQHEPGSLLAWLVMRCGRESKRPTPDVLAAVERPATLVAYINSMFNLGMRFEDRHAAEHNLAQALRYYEKAAKLGSDQARMRLGVQCAAPTVNDASRVADGTQPI